MLGKRFARGTLAGEGGDVRRSGLSRRTLGGEIVLAGRRLQFPYTDLQIGHRKAPFLLSLLLQDPRCVKTREIGAMHSGGVVAVGMLPREIDLPLRIRKVVVHL